MGYSFDSRVRYSETGEDGKLTLPALLDYFQDCCTFQTDSIRQGIRELRARNRFWVLSSWQVIILRYPEQGERIITTTFPYKLQGFTGLRNFSMESGSGERLAVANSQFALLSTETGLPVRMTEEDLRGYVLDEKLDMDYAQRKIDVPEQMEKKEPFVIQAHHLDANHHVNNCQYVRMALDYAPKGMRFGSMRAEYKKQGRLGDVFVPETGRDKDRYVVNLADPDGRPYAVVELAGILENGRNQAE